MIGIDACDDALDKQESVKHVEKHNVFDNVGSHDGKMEYMDNINRLEHELILKLIDWIEYRHVYFQGFDIPAIHSVAMYTKFGRRPLRGGIPSMYDASSTYGSTTTLTSFDNLHSPSPWCGITF